MSQLNQPRSTAITARRASKSGDSVAANSARQAQQSENPTTFQYLQRTLGNRALGRASAGQPASPPTDASRSARDPNAFATNRIAQISSISKAPNAGPVQRWPFKKTKKFTSNEGLLDLGNDIKGEVGVESIIKSGTKLYDPADKGKKNPRVIKTIDKDLKGFYHDLGDAKWTLARIPAQSVGDTEKAKKVDFDRSKDLDKPQGGDLEGLVKKNQVKRTGTKFQHRDKKDDLFPYVPDAHDIEQRALGDCYFLAALSSVARQNPSYISSMMGDNGNGTVSVRFYKVAGEDDAPTFTPEYVTVRKSLVVDRFGSSKYQGGKALWPGMAVKAYAAWNGHQKEALPGFKGTYQGVAGGHNDIAWQHILGQAAKGKKGRANPNAEASNVWSLGDGEFKGADVAGGGNKEFVYPWDRDLTKDRRMFFSAVKGDDEINAKADGIARSLVTPTRNFQTIRQMLIVKGKFVTVPTPLMLQSFIPTLSDADGKAWATHIASAPFDKVKSDYLQLGDKKATKTLDLEFMSTLLAQTTVSKPGQQAMLTYCSRFMDGNPQKPSYSDDALALYQKVSERLAKNAYVGLGTPDYGKGTGISGGENTEVVPGIAGGHAYDVVSTRADKDGRLYFRVRNPWGTFGRGYDKDFKGTAIKAGEFDVELSDIRRYFNEVNYSANVQKVKVDESNVEAKISKTVDEVQQLLDMKKKNPAPWVIERLHELKLEMEKLMGDVDNAGKGGDLKGSRNDMQELIEILKSA